MSMHIYIYIYIHNRFRVSFGNLQRPPGTSSRSTAPWSGSRGTRKETCGVSTNGVIANVVFFDRGTFGVLPSTYMYLSKSARAYLFPNPSKSITFAAVAFVLTPLSATKAHRRHHDHPRGRGLLPTRPGNAAPRDLRAAAAPVRRVQRLRLHDQAKQSIQHNIAYNKQHNTNNKPKQDKQTHNKERVFTIRLTLIN